MVLVLVLIFLIIQIYGGEIDMGKKKEKGFDPLDETLKFGQVSAGTMLVGGMPHMIGKSLPGTSGMADRISNVSGRVLPVFPVMQGTHSVFGSLRYLEDTVKNKKKR